MFTYLKIKIIEIITKNKEIKIVKFKEKLNCKYSKLQLLRINK